MTLRRLDGRLGTLEATLASDPYSVLGDEQPRSATTNLAWPEAFYTSNFSPAVRGSHPAPSGDTGDHELWVPILGEPMLEGDQTFNLSLTAVTGSLVLGVRPSRSERRSATPPRLPCSSTRTGPAATSTPPQPDGHDLHLEFALAAGQSYVVETSSNLVDWAALVTNVAAGWQGSFTASNLLARPYQFYRLRNP